MSYTRGKGEMHYRFLVAKPEGKSPLGRSRSKGEDDIKSNINEIGCENMNWIRLPKKAVVNTAMNFQVPQTQRHFLLAEKLADFQAYSAARNYISLVNIGPT